MDGSAEQTAPKQQIGIPFKPGQSGNPAGRPKGARSKLGTLFLEQMLEDFTTHGAKVIEDVRNEKPDQYLKVVASILPKEIEPSADLLDAISGITRRVIDPNA
jgi:hypothetical protein